MRFSIPTPADFSFKETLSAHGWRRLLPFVWQEDTQTLERMEQLSQGRVIRLRLQAEAGQVCVEVGGGSDEAGSEELEIARRVRRMLQLDLPLEEFHGFCRTRPELGHIVEAQQGRMLCCPTLFEDTVKVIATSNTTWAQTITMTERIVEHFGAPDPSFPDRHAFPTASQIAAVPFDEFAAKARMGYRDAYVYATATQIADGTLDLESWQNDNLSAEELRKRLLSLPGIGPYGAACLMLYLGRPEHVNADSWARTLVAKEIGRSVTDAEVRTFFEGYGPWRGLVYTFYDWKPAPSLSKPAMEE